MVYILINNIHSGELSTLYYARCARKFIIVYIRKLEHECRLTSHLRSSTRDFRETYSFYTLHNANLLNEVATLLMNNVRVQPSEEVHMAQSTEYIGGYMSKVTVCMMVDCKESIFKVPQVL